MDLPKELPGPGIGSHEPPNPKHCVEESPILSPKLHAKKLAEEPKLGSGFVWGFRVEGCVELLPRDQACRGVRPWAAAPRQRRLSECRKRLSALPPAAVSGFELDV